MARLRFCVNIAVIFCWNGILFVYLRTMITDMTKKAYTDQEEQIARFAKAMGHPARMAILQFLVRQDSCFFGDIHEVLPIAKATVSQHLKELKEAGLKHRKSVIVSTVRIGRWRAIFLSVSSVTARTKIPAAGERLFLLILFVVRRITFNEKQIWRLKYWERGAPDARYSTKR